MFGYASSLSLSSRVTFRRDLTVFVERGMDGDQSSRPANRAGGMVVYLVPDLRTSQKSVHRLQFSLL